jgi:hypothetical protein
MTAPALPVSAEQRAELTRIPQARTLPHPHLLGQGCVEFLREPALDQCALGEIDLVRGKGRVCRVQLCDRPKHLLPLGEQLQVVCEPLLGLEFGEFRR